MIGAVKLGLDEEEVLRVADVLLQISWHGLERLEQLGENAPVGCDHRIRGIRYIEVHRPVVGVDDDLHRISDVIRSSTGKRLSIGEPIARRVSVLHPEEPPVAHHHIGVMVQAEEGGNCANAILDVATDKNAALARDVIGEQDVQVVEIPGEEGPPHHSANSDAVRTLVGRVNVVVAL